MKKKPELFIKLVLSKKVSEMGGISQKHKLTIFAALLVPSHNSKQQQPKKPEAFFSYIISSALKWICNTRGI